MANPKREKLTTEKDIAVEVVKILRGSPMRSFSHSAIVRTIGPKLSNKYYHLVAIVLNTLVDN
ncbi:MAG: hypothetical protein RSB93_05120, partial [Rikenellaceae bacterium]